MSRENIPFIKSEVDVAPLFEGSFVDVSRLDIPQEVKEKIANKYGVVKEYKTPYHDFLTDGLDKNKCNTLEVAKLLQRRQRFLKYYFRDLPSFVVESDYVIGGTKESPKIYEFQQFIDNSLSLDSLYRNLDLNEFKWKSKGYLKLEIPQRMQWLLSKLNLEAFKNMENELALLFDLYKKMSIWEPSNSDDQEFKEFSHKILDLEGEDNVYITSNGSLRLIDTNILFNFKKTDALIRSYTSEDFYYSALKKLWSAMETAHDVILWGSSSEEDVGKIILEALD